MSGARQFSHYISSPPVFNGRPRTVHGEAVSEELIWFRLRQLADVPEQGMALFAGTLAERRARYKYFRAFVRQAEVYWNAAKSTQGSAAALPYYYSVLQLAKAELLKTFPERIEGKVIHHGLQARNAKGSKIRGDRLSWTKGVFSLLYECRTGSQLPTDLSPKVLSLLSIIPEIGLEMNQIGLTRPSSIPGFHAIAADKNSAWSTVLLFTSLDSSEKSYARLLRGYEEIEKGDYMEWRAMFGLSSRFWGIGAKMLQSKKTFSSGGNPDRSLVPNHLSNLMGDCIAPPTANRADFMLVSTLTKSSHFVLPLPLVRYAAMFYLSSVVRYQPIKLDSVSEGAQAYLMDSVVHELPIYLLGSALDEISGKTTYYEPGAFRV